MLNTLTPQRAALFVALSLLAVLVGAWIFEWAGYPPCELCLLQRWAYYFGIPFAALLAVARPRWLSTGLWLLAVVLAANAVFGIYHAGVEWKFWAGPSTCSGAGALTLEPGNLLEGLKKPGVMCNEAAIRILGLSLAGWNAIICAGLAALCVKGATTRIQGSSSVSQ
jgi:disulfide bond formation protein DsbB